MGELFKLKNQIQNYAWGSHTTLAQMRGVPVPTQDPEAEVWVGAHPSAPSIALLDGQEQGLDQLVEQDPQRFLVAERSNDAFPYLFKILAIDAPLSIQVHPTDEQAEEGFADENARGIALDAPHRNYKDRFSKPETVIAVSEVKILTGVRDAHQLDALASGFNLEWLQALLPAPTAKDLLTTIIQLDEDATVRAVDETVAAAAAYSGDERVLVKAAELVEMVAGKYPGDRGLLVALVMNYIELAPGESAFTPDGQVHAYLDGTAIELMNPSDNVMRAGLTPKHIDTDELIKILAVEQGSPEIQTPERITPGVATYAMWDQRLSVTRVQVREDAPIEFTFEGTSTLISTGGQVTITGAGQSFEITGTESVMHVGAPVTATITGTGDLYIAAHR
ncbi:mannose-6-phosphate isomerase, class I [Rothia sp. ZJ1223]|uniref:mannose-6-phosphate isomerase, class I n=1 Tax=Rothia sp. ZJ1223 TaxID=2811098 RepID=UPI00195B3E54|nr:mannose-6-phosphate isomerase, class I [Rothia sp. ZJ1223]MBM7052238.1 mannose-6-phosphate isomerase, class I [Rothia sp. ZJ1223]